MLVPLKWLRDFVDYDASAQELAEALTMSGLEVEGVEERFSGLGTVVVAKVTEVEPHPNADKLRLATVTTGDEQFKIVCGAPNVRAGMTSALALPGTVLGEGMKVGKAKIRGVESIGMLCSQRELGISEDHSGIMDLDDSLVAGSKVVDALGLETRVLEIGITPNRGDALSILGVARDVAAIYDLPLKTPEISFKETGAPIAEAAKVEVLDVNGCPRYAARVVRGVKIGPSPLFMADRVSACGMRSINNVVDITNYVLMELGQPLHAFDYQNLAGGIIRVRQAKEGEKFVTLDGQERVLQAGMLLICDDERPVALAGVMGGLNSEIEDNTENVLIESAHFDALNTRRTSKRLNLPTEAAYRFERGVDPEGCVRAADRAAQLMADYADGEVAKGLIDAYGKRYQAPSLPLSISKTARFLGLPLTKEQVCGQLERLGLEVLDGEDDDHIVAKPPAFRPDLERPVDLTEEVARMIGFDNIPVKLPTAGLMSQPQAWDQAVRGKAQDLMAAQGFDEAVCYSFAHPDSISMLGIKQGDPRSKAVSILNPLSEDQSVLRTTLLPGLMTALRRNLSHRVEDPALFEVGKCFIKRDDQEQPFEPMRLCGVMAGLAAPPSWWLGEAKASLAYIRGAVEYLIQGLGLEEPVFEQTPGLEPYLDDGLSCRIMISGKQAGYLGLMKPEVAEAWDIEKQVFLFDLDFDLICEMAPKVKRYEKLPRYPEVVRDLAMIVDKQIGAGEVLSAAREAKDKKARKWLKHVEMFDLYQGKPLAKNEKSLGLRFHYRDENRTLKEKEVIPVHEKQIGRVLERFNAKQRS